MFRTVGGKNIVLQIPPVDQVIPGSRKLHAKATRHTLIQVARSTHAS